MPAFYAIWSDYKTTSPLKSLKRLTVADIDDFLWAKSCMTFYCEDDYLWQSFKGDFDSKKK